MQRETERGGRERRREQSGFVFHVSNLESSVETSKIARDFAKGGEVAACARDEERKRKRERD